MNILGWSAEQNKFKQDINICHLLVIEDDATVCACGKKVARISKELHITHPPVRVCRQCRRIAKRQGANL